MKKLPLIVMMTVLCGCLALVGRAASPKTEVVPLGGDTFSITRSATSGFNRNVEQLKEQAKQDAEQYCSAQGKQLRVISLTSEKPFFATGYAKAKIVFKAANPGDPEEAPVAKASASGGSSSSSDDVYNSLIKLDDLRKKGILTDEEFEAEKKKVLKRSH